MVLAFALLAPMAPAKTSPWNGTWVLDAAPSTHGAKAQAADAYRFTLQPDGGIKWQIPSLGEVVTGKTDGQSMTIHRSRPTPGLTLSVKAEGPTVLL